MLDDPKLSLGGADEPGAPPGGAGRSTLRGVQPPADLATLLAGLPAPCRALYTVVRGEVDEIESAVSWQLLYYPPDDAEQLRAPLQHLAATIRRLPDRLAPCLEGFAADDAEAQGEPIRGEVEFYFRSVEHMVEKDLTHLAARLDQLAGTSAEETERLCELAADLKGKFASATMSATAALVAQGRWESLAVEPLLFPEKAAEFERSRELLAALRTLFELLAELPQRVPLAALVERWRAGQRVDQYAFADLVMLRGHLGALLREPSRRALYSGDYHQIRQREVQLAERIAELEAIHRQSWTMTGLGAADLLAVALPRLECLAAEIAALTDVHQLKSLVGEKTVARLRSRVATADGATDPLVRLLAHDDLRLFAEMLLGAVQRRASLAGERVATMRPPAPAPVTVELPAPSAKAPGPPVPAPASPARQAALLAELRRHLRELLDPQNARWNNFRMVLRLFARHGRLPDAMVGASLPFVEEFLNVIVPDLHLVAPYRGLSPELVERIEGTCKALLTPGATPSGSEALARQRLERLHHFLSALGSVVGGG